MEKKNKKTVHLAKLPKDKNSFGEHIAKDITYLPVLM